METKKDIKKEIINQAESSAYIDVDMECLKENLKSINERHSLTEIRDSLNNFHNFLNGYYNENQKSNDKPYS